MTHVNRRQILKTTGVGAGVALGSGVTGGLPQTSGEAINGGSETVLTTFTATAETGRIAIDVPDPDSVEFGGFDATDIPDGREELIKIEGEILRSGRWVAEEITLPQVLDILLAVDIDQGLDDFIDGLDLEAELEALDAEELFQNIVTVIATFDIDPETAIETIEDLLAAVGFGIPFSVVESILFNGIEEIEGYDEGYSFEEWLAEPALPPFLLVLSNVDTLLENIDVFDVGTSELPDGTPDPNEILDSIVNIVLDIAEFDDLGELETELESLLDGVSINELLAENQDIIDLIDIEIETGGINGKFDPREDDPVGVTVPVHGMDITIALLAFDDELGDVPVTVDMTFTSGESGARNGSVDLETESGELTLVENEFVAGIDEFAISDLIDALGLDELLDVIVEAFDVADLLVDAIEAVADDLLDEFDIEALLESIDIDGIIEELSLVELTSELTFVDALIADIIQDESGRHAVEFDFDLTFDDGLNGDDFAAPEEPLIEGGGLPQDINGVGLFEDLTGNGETTVADVQLLFEEMNTIPPEQSGFYNFSGVNSDQVTIFDVQALFNRTT